jgi:cell division protein FtsI (penicillin-binding protein 3)
VPTKRRLAGLLTIFGLLFGLLVLRLADVQVLHPGRFDQYGEQQRMVSETIEAPRGSIFDRNGEDLAMSVPQTTVYADPKLVSDPIEEARKLAPVLGVDRLKLQDQLSGPGRFVYLAREISDEEAAKVKALKLDGIAFENEYKRVYPAGNLARGLLGVTAVDGTPLNGLEKQYGQLLAGTPGKLVFEDSKVGTIAGGQDKKVPAKAGQDLVLTIDRSLQYQTEQLLAAQVKATGSKGGIVIVSDPSTGEVLTMADMVTDPDTGNVVPSSSNGALITVFEPGSVNKVVTVAAALEEGAVTPSTILHVPGALMLGGARFTDAETHPSDLTTTDILTISSNLGTILMAEKIGAKSVDEYLRKFGFGSTTGLGFPNEAAGLMLPLDQWSGSSIGSIPIGQGVAVTAMQMLDAYNVIANDGMFVAPKLVAAEIDAGGQRHATPPSPSHRVVSETTAQEVRGMLTNVVLSGTGEKAAIPGYVVAGKTGTARKPQSKHLPDDGYADLNGQYHYVSTFVGMVPAEHPRLSIIVVMDEPSTSHSYFAADVAAPLFSQVGALALRRFDIPPATPGDDPFANVPAVAESLARNADEPAVGPNAAPSTTERRSGTGRSGG